eukprot:TRINITY_DN3_c0_g1_i4.p2 TRINITY_DN3_c0_g1~~TRINITY_DN3_c0_g1_i4.p2  ORF type:complete len:100 (-),score=21.08 TRINITY_DN3_c0_g1_i4:16-315(-)
MSLVLFTIHGGMNWSGREITVTIFSISSGPSSPARLFGSISAFLQIMFANLRPIPVSYTHLRAHETPEHLVCRLLLEKKKKKKNKKKIDKLMEKSEIKR